LNFFQELFHFNLVCVLQTIPRTVVVNSKIGVNFINWPIEEVESLRISEQVHTGVKLDANAILKVNGATWSQVSSMDWNTKEGK